MKKNITLLFVAFTLAMPVGGFSQSISQIDLHRIVAEASVAEVERSSLEKQLFEAVSQTWVAFEHSDWSKMQTMITSDFVFVGTPGVLDGEQLAKFAESCKLNAFTLKDAQVRILDDNSAVLVYTAQRDFRCNGQAQPSTLLVADSLTRKNGQWLAAAHVETAFEEAPKTAAQDNAPSVERSFNFFGHTFAVH
jgi:hypothetical protein